jgi:thioredoxin 1
MKSASWIIVLVVLAIVIVIGVKQMNKKTGSPVNSTSQPVAAAIPKANDSSHSSNVLIDGKLDACLDSGKPTMAEISLGTCDICRQMVPIINAVADEWAGRVNVVNVNQVYLPKLKHLTAVQSIPTQIFYDSRGEEVKRHMGKLTKTEIELEFQKLVAKPGAKK